MKDWFENLLAALVITIAIVGIVFTVLSLAGVVKF